MGTVFEGVWVNVKGRFIPPNNAHTLIDLSPLDNPGSRGLFLSDDNLGFDYRIITDVENYAWNALTLDSSPNGVGKPKPLVPSTNGLELYLGTMGIAKRERFRWGQHPHTNILRDILREDFRACFDNVQSGKSKIGQDRKVLDWLSKRYNCDWKEFVTPNLRAHIEGILPHETTLLESFDTADTITLGPDQTWVEYVDNTPDDLTWDVLSNQARVLNRGGVQGNYARAESDLSSSDHYSQVVATDLGGVGENSQIGVACRFSGANVTCYACRALRVNNTLDLWKASAGTVTTIGTPAAITISVPTLIKIQASGSTVKVFWGGVETRSETDTTISGNTRCGIYGFVSSGISGKLDDFEAADLGVGSLIDNTRNVLHNILGSAV